VAAPNGTRILDDVSFTCPAGTRTAVIGANGSGKSTLLLALAGAMEVESGTIEVAGPVGLLVQDPDVAWVTGSVAEEIRTILRWREIPGEEAESRLATAMKLLDLAHLADRDPRTLSGGEQQRVQLAAVLVTRPRVLLLDEPVSHLDPRTALEVRAAWHRSAPPGGTWIEAVTDPGTAHDADRWVVLQAGRVLDVGSPAEVLGRADRTGWEWSTGEVASASGGRRIASGEPGAEKGHAVDGGGVSSAGPVAPRLVARGVSIRAGGRTLLGAIDLEVRAGEAVGVLGRSGTGKTLLLETLAGVRRPQAGEVRVNGVAPGPPPGKAFPELGLVMAFPERQFFADTVTDEVRFGVVRARRRRGVAREGPGGAEVVDQVRRELDSVGLDPGHHDQSPWSLSGGERRRVAVATALAHRPGLLLLDEPSVGLDPHGAAALARRLGEEVEEGMAVILAGHDLPWLTRVVTRIVAIEDGWLVPIDPMVPSDLELIDRLGYPIPPEWRAAAGG
jgi:energy-coupling factor transport system ATP-binding protein